MSEKRKVGPAGIHEIEPWDHEVDGALLFDEMVELLKEHLSLPQYAAETMSLWVMHCHAFEVATVTPILALVSPEKRCGKTTALALLDALVPRSLVASNITPAATFRSVDKWRPTLLIDEADTFIRSNDDLRGILNSGHTKSSAYVIRTIGEQHTPYQFSTWCPKAIALIGQLPDTLEDRAIVVLMRRRSPEEQIVRFHRDRVTDIETLGRKAARWVQDHLEELRGCDPILPKELHDRAQDNWRPLLAIANVAGGRWPALGAQAAKAMSGAGSDDDSGPGELLLADFRLLFRKQNRDRLSSQTILDHLASMDERPWPEWKQGKPITACQVARLLRPFGIRPTTFREGEIVRRGYEVEQFEDAFHRYLPFEPQQAQQVRDSEEEGDEPGRNNPGDVAHLGAAEKLKDSTLLRMLPVTDPPSAPLESTPVTQNEVVALRLACKVRA